MFKFLKKKGLATLEELYFPDTKIEWRSPWRSFQYNVECRNSIQKELNLEVGPKHPLWGFKPVVIAKSEANDDVIVHLNDGRFASVHLVWHGKIDQIPDKFPSVTFVESENSLQKFLDEKSDPYS